jgi:hypothetical protein
MLPESRNRLKIVRDGLLRLHGKLLHSEKAAYERDVAKIEGPNHFLGLVLEDPWFAWLRELSQFIVMIDETLAAKEPAGNDEAVRILRRAREFAAPNEHGETFGKRYYDATQRDPGVILAHREMLEVFEQAGA